MFGIRNRKHRAGDEAIQAIDAGRQIIDDAALRQRVMDTADQTLAVARRVNDDGPGGGSRLVSARLNWQVEDDTLVYKVICADGIDYEIAVENDEPPFGPSLFVTSRRHSEGVVTWTPGAGFTSPAEFLDWFRNLAATTA